MRNNILLLKRALQILLFLILLFTFIEGVWLRVQ
jgi:hypothetical protein